MPLSGSSSLCSDPLFNPEYLRKPLTLEVAHKDGTVELINTLGVEFRAGANLAFNIDEDDEDIQLTVGPGVGQEDPYFRQKFNALVSLTSANDGGSPLTGPYLNPATGEIPDGPAWSFTRNSMWIASINGVGPDPISGAFFFTQMSCTILGLFETNDGYPEASAAYLQIVDQCVPCNLDNCLVLDQLWLYLDRLTAFYNYVFELLYKTDTTTIPAHPDGGIVENYAGVNMQHQALRGLWDYQVHRSSFKLGALGQGQSIVATAYYRNVSNVTVGAPGLTLTLVFEFYRNGVLWDNISSELIKGKVLFRDDADNPPNEILFKRFVSQSFSPAPEMAHTYTVVLDTYDGGDVDLVAGGVARADFVIMITDTEDFDDGADYTVRVIGTLTPTHLIETGNPTGEVTTERLVSFVPGDVFSASST